MRSSITLFFFLILVVTARADDKIAGVQQSLKDQGFYYGEITGEKNADTSAAIRRYQIRNGLQITGELNDETMRSIKSGAGSAAASSPAAPAPVATAKPALTARAPSPAPDTSGLREETTRAPDGDEEPAPRYSGPPAQDRREAPVYPGRPVPPAGGNFIGTPYEGAPPDVLQNVIVRAQKRLAKIDLYRGEITGVYGPDLEFSLRAYQSRVGLRATGRLDLETLAALELLPGAGAPVYRPRRALREPPVRGEWIRP